MSFQQARDWCHLQMMHRGEVNSFMEALNMTLKIPYEAYFQPSDILVVIIFMFILTDTCSGPIYLYLFLSLLILKWVLNMPPPHTDPQR